MCDETRALLFVSCEDTVIGICDVRSYNAAVITSVGLQKMRQILNTIFEVKSCDGGIMLPFTKTSGDCRKKKYSFKAYRNRDVFSHAGFCTKLIISLLKVRAALTVKKKSLFAFRADICFISKV